MTQTEESTPVLKIPLDLIDVLNPRERNQKVFAEIVRSIKATGLKKPITVTPRTGPDGTERYTLIYGEGRMKAFRLLGESEIPALVVDRGDHDAYIMSLIENLARYKYSAAALLESFGELQRMGYGPKQIAEKTDNSITFVNGVLLLLKYGEERLMAAVMDEVVPITIAVNIVNAGHDDKAIQISLQDAYESGDLRGDKMGMVSRLLARRKDKNKNNGYEPTPGKKSGMSSANLIRTYQREVARQQLMVKKAEYAEQRLLVIVGALQSLYADENFGNLLRAECLDTLPTYLAERIWSGRASA